MNLFKVLQGTIQHDASLVNGRTVAEERLHQLTVMRGKEQEPTNEIVPGDIATVAKLSDTGTGDVLGARGADVEVEPFTPPQPVLAIAIHPKAKGDEDKLANALHRLLDEDPVLQLERNSETKQTLLRGMGETHRSITLEKLHRKLGVEVETEEVEGRVPRDDHRRRRGRGQVQEADRRARAVRRRLHPRRTSAGAGFEFVDRIVGGTIPRQFIPTVEKGVAETMSNGGVYGYPVVDVTVTVFRRQGALRRLVRDELQDGGLARVQGGDGQGRPDPARADQRDRRDRARAVPGDLMGDLNSKRGRILGSSAAGNGEMEIVAQVPTSEVLRYEVDLRSPGGAEAPAIEALALRPGAGAPRGPHREATRGGPSGLSVSSVPRADPHRTVRHQPALDAPAPPVRTAWPTAQARASSATSSQPSFDGQQVRSRVLLDLGDRRSTCSAWRWTAAPRAASGCRRCRR